MSSGKIGLAAQLAKQASEAALAEFKNSEEPAKPEQKPWRVPDLAGDFRLDEAWLVAAARVAQTYGASLAPEGLHVRLTSIAPPADAVAPEPELNLRAEVREVASGRVLRAYTAPELVGLFAVQRGEKGVVADGVV